MITEPLKITAWSQLYLLDKKITFRATVEIYPSRKRHLAYYGEDWHMVDDGGGSIVDERYIHDNGAVTIWGEF